MTLENYLKNNKIEKIGPSPESAKAKLIKAIKIFKNIQNIIGVADNEVIYPLAHDAARMACEATLFLNGYRVKKNIAASHYIIIDCAKELAGESLNLEFTRLEKTRQKRNQLEYGDLNSISQSELEQALKDLKKLLIYGRDLLEKGESRNKLV